MRRSYNTVALRTNSTGRRQHEAATKIANAARRKWHVKWQAAKLATGKVRFASTAVRGRQRQIAAVAIGRREWQIAEVAGVPVGRRQWQVAEVAGISVGGWEWQVAKVAETSLRGRE